MLELLRGDNTDPQMQGDEKVAAKEPDNNVLEGGQMVLVLYNGSEEVVVFRLRKGGDIALAGELEFARMLKRKRGREWGGGGL